MVPNIKTDRGRALMTTIYTPSSSTAVGSSSSQDVLAQGVLGVALIRIYKSELKDYNS